MSNFMSEHLDKSSAKQVEFVGDYIYVGIAKVGAIRSEPIWSIKRIDTLEPISITWAEGTPEFIHIMDNYASYTYS